jgi:RimJ/RimL family protein N-acetyltransferase
VELTAGKVVLREKRLEDAWMDYLWRSDEEISRLDAAYPIKMKFEEFLRLFKDQLRYPTPASARFGIDTRDGKYIGNCMYYDMDTVNKQAEIGIVIGDRDYWSQGYGYDAVVTLLAYLFSNGSVERLYLHTLQWNKRAQRAFEKCGFSPVKQVRRNGMDFVLMAIKKDHWLEIRDEKLAARDTSAQTTQD